MKNCFTVANARIIGTIISASIVLIWTNGQTKPMRTLNSKLGFGQNEPNEENEWDKERRMNE